MAPNNYAKSHTPFVPLLFVDNIRIVKVINIYLLGRIYIFALRMCIEDDSSSVNVNDESWSIYTFQWLNSFH